jgi:hypothetical protein
MARNYEAEFRAEFPLVEVFDQKYFRMHYRPRELIVTCASWDGPWARTISSGRGRWRELYARWSVPYGVWVIADGREVLFNRLYQPIWQRRPGRVVEPIEPQWIDWVSERWFYGDGNAPRVNPSMRRTMDNVLIRFRCGEDVTSYLDRHDARKARRDRVCRGMDYRYLN